MSISVSVEIVNHKTLILVFYDKIDSQKNEVDQKYQIA